MQKSVQSEPVGQLKIASTAAPPSVRKKQEFLTAVMHACDASGVITGKNEFAGGTVTTCKLSYTRITVITANAQPAVQASTVIGRRSGALHICAPLTGSLTLNQDSRQTELLPGQMAMFDSTRPFRLTMHEGFRMVVVCLSHQTVGIHSRHTEPLTAIPWESISGVGAVASSLLTALGTHLSELDCTAIEPLGNGIRNMMLSLIAEQFRQSTAHTVSLTGARQMLMIRIQGWARAHLSDITLAPSALARQHNISLRYLQVLFAEQGTSPAKWIRDERLAHCHEDLRNPQYDHLTIAAIGDRWGLCGGASQVSHLFRDQYGCPPGEIRRHRQIAVAS